ncbi:MAG: ABC transporter ATP-binding protein [Chloroflexota bacterium]|nr:ABC transporter ATP-binding protein [Chloroflexota bacterium]
MTSETIKIGSQETQSQMDELQKRSENSLLSVQDLKVWFELRRLGFGVSGYVHAVDGVNFDLDYGETIAIVGESGCGKTTLMKSILALYRPTEGEIFFEGSTLSTLKGAHLQEYRSNIGYVQQDPYGALAPFMNIQRILEEPMIINGITSKKERRDRIFSALEEVKMSPPGDFLQKFPHMLSGGQQQRIVLARAMLLEPKMIVADEPVSMLDASVRVEILRLLESLQEKHNLAVIYITHDLSTVRYFSERVFVMYAGQLIEKTLIDNIVHDPKHPYSQALMEATSDPDANNALHYRDVPPGEPPSLVNPPSGCRFHPRCPYKIDGLCEVEVPPYFVTKEDQYVACWLYK